MLTRMLNHWLAVVKDLTQDVVGTHVWNGAIAECQTMPTDQYDATEDAAAAILERVAVAVEWDRLLMWAAWRHMELHPDRKETGDYWSEATNVCGECLREALLSQALGAPDWKQQPSAELTRAGVDWAAVIAESYKHRRGEIRRTYRMPHRGR